MCQNILHKLLLSVMIQTKCRSYEIKNKFRHFKIHSGSFQFLKVYLSFNTLGILFSLALLNVDSVVVSVSTCYLQLVTNNSHMKFLSARISNNADNLFLSIAGQSIA